jgi:MFS family permease
MNPVYLKLSGMFFLEFAVWGAWMPVLAARLLGPLKMSGKQTGWIYATLPIASMIAPLGAGQLADKYVDMGWLLLAAHAIGAVLLFLAARIQKFGSLFGVMLLYSMLYGASLPLANAMIFRHLEAADAKASSVFIWAPIAWALAGYALTGWRMLSKADGDGSDCLKFAAVLSVVMAVFCAFLPATPPVATAGAPMAKAFSMLQDPGFLAFTLVSLVVAGMMQFYFLGTAPFMQDSGVAGKTVPAAMALAQAVQAVATFFLLDRLYHDIGPKWTLAVGAGSWLLLYVLYVSSPMRSLLVAGQALHGLAYVLFINGGWMFTNDASDPAIAGSAQSLIILATNGIGLFLGTQLAGLTMDRFSSGGRFQWKKIFMVPLACVLAGLLVLAVVVKDPVKAAAPEAPAAATSAAK